MARVEVAACGHDERHRVRREAESLPQLAIGLGSLRVHPRWRPARAGRRSERPGTDQHDVGHGPQEAHHEAVGRAVAAHRAAIGVPVRVERDGAVEALHEVGDDRRSVVR